MTIPSPRSSRRRLITHRSSFSDTALTPQPRSPRSPRQPSRRLSRANDGRCVYAAEGGRGRVEARRRDHGHHGLNATSMPIGYTHTHVWVHQGAWHAPPSHPNDHPQSEHSTLPGCSPQFPSASQEPVPASASALASALASLSSSWKATMAGPADETNCCGGWLSQPAGTGARPRSNVHAADEGGGEARTPSSPNPEPQTYRP